jgi:hypothetical protein
MRVKTRTLRSVPATHCAAAIAWKARGAPRPVDHHHEAIAEADQVPEVHGESPPPGDEAA